MSSAPLAVFRIVFGAIMALGVVRFWFNGWIQTQYLQPRVFFPYYGFEWVKPLGETGMYILFALMAISAVCITLGLFYRIAAPTFFVIFTYVELIDQSNYLNHYYFVSLLAFLLLFVPAHVRFSLDVRIRPSIKQQYVPRWTIGIIRLQLGLLYFFAGLAKVNTAWLIDANPMRIWLPAHNHLPIIGTLLSYTWVAYLFSWLGCVYDLTVPFFLSWKKTRVWAFGAVVVFHLATALFFQIGMFPYIMIGATLIFFSGEYCDRVLAVFERKSINIKVASRKRNTWVLPILGVFLMIQLLMPLRYMFYEGNLFWHEQGYRFSWRVMLIEKAGTAFFKVRDHRTGREEYVCNRAFLTPQQEKMMATQPDMILTYAHIIEDEYKKKGYDNIGVYAESYASLNGAGSRPFIDPTVDLCDYEEGFQQKTWVLPYE